MKLINKIRKADFSKKTNLFIECELSNDKIKELVNEMILSLPKGHYKLHSREYGQNLIDAVYNIYGWMPSMHINESTMLGLQVLYPKRVYATFTLGLDAIEIK